jgi:lipoprotein-anchoring transpeptidase ErfK/SrfK
VSEDDLERTLRDAFAARAQASVGDTDQPPPPRFAGQAAVSAHRRRVRLFAPLAAAAAVLAVVGGIVAITNASDDGGGRHVIAGGSSPAGTAAASVSASAPTTPVPSSSPTAPTQSVHIKLFNADGSTYGVGMPVVAYFSGRITDARALAAATSVTVAGKPLTTAWYFVPSTAGQGPIEGHLRPEGYWPAHAKIHVGLKTQGLSAGRGIVYNDSLTLDFTTGPRTVAIVNDAKHAMTVTEDGKPLGTYPVSLGASKTPTTRGTKVIMAKGASICMSGPGYNECGIKYTQRLTYSGEYLHAAPWNEGNITRGIDSSNGCTNLMPADAARLYKTLRVGDIVQYPDAPGPEMTLGTGFGDWNIPWAQWRKGGLIPA